jgi:squalene-hopene/tetraprenyl-beta-curcumene cyclase
MDTQALIGRYPDIDSSIATAADALWAEQRPDGSWEGFLPSSSLSTAVVAMALSIADPEGSADLMKGSADWIIADQNPDGGWADVPSGPSTLNATAIALSGLTMARPGAVAEIDRGKAALERLGGQNAVEVEDNASATLNLAVRTSLALAGHYHPLPAPGIPTEVALLPRRLQRKVSFAQPVMYALAIMRAHTRPPGRARRQVSQMAEERAMRYLRGMLEFEGPDGGCEESALVVAWIVIGLALAGVGQDIIEKYLGYLRRSVRPDGSWPVVRDMELAGTCYAAQGLQEAGFGGDRRLRPTIDWIKASQRQVPVPATGCPAGGWGRALPSSWPDVDDTSLALLTLAGLGVEAKDQHMRDGVAWLRAMQNRNGSWGRFVRNGQTLFDGPCSALTAHAMMALHEAGGARHRLARALRWLAQAQEPNGSLSCGWFRDSTSGTAYVLKALGQLGLSDHPVARECLRWLLDHQLPDGGWGDGHQAPASAQETAWALLGLSSAGQASNPAAAAAAQWLVSTQRADGGWDPSQVCYYLPGLTYWCDAMTNGFALQALARYRNAKTR